MKGDFAGWLAIDQQAQGTRFPALLLVLVPNELRLLKTLVLTGLWDIALFSSASKIVLLLLSKPENISAKSPPKLKPRFFSNTGGGFAVLA